MLDITRLTDATLTLSWTEAGRRRRLELSPKPPCRVTLTREERVDGSWRTTGSVPVREVTVTVE